MHDLLYQFGSNLKATWHYRWFAVALAWLIALYGWIAVYRMPDRFEASARVWVDTQSVIKNYMYGITAQPNVSLMAGSISRTLTSRPNLERVIALSDVDFGLQTPEDRQKLITRLNREVTVQSVGSDLYAIVYTDSNPHRAKQVVQSLLTIFVEGSRSDQRTDAESARRFIDEELNTSKQKMDAAENAVIEFKRRQVRAASGRADNVRLIDAQVALKEATLELNAAEASLNAIKKNLADTAEIPTLFGDQGTDGEANAEIDGRIQSLEQKLDGLRVNYTEQHPDIVAIVRTIAQLKEQKKADATLRRPSSNALRAAPPPSTLSLATAEANVAALRARVAEFRKRYDEIRAEAIAAPEIDAQYGQLSRDYEMAKNSYGALLSRRETARISNEMETRTSATNFRVVDPPQVPSVPKGPNRQLLNSIVLLMALGGGVGLAFVLSQIRPTFNDERRLRDATGVQVLGTVVGAWTDKQKARQSRGLAALLLSFVSLLTAYAAIFLGLVLTASRG